MSMLTLAQAKEILPKHTTEQHLFVHAAAVSAAMGAMAEHFGEDKAYWEAIGYLHDVDFENWPEEHCLKAPELLAEVDASPEMVHAICSHGYGICCDVEPTALMEKILFAADELTGLIGAAAKMRPSKSVMDMELSSLKKKFKDKKFAAGCSRDVIKTGAERLGWTLDELMEKTILAMRSCEASIAAEMDVMGL